MKSTQTARLLEFIRSHPGCTTMEIQLGMQPFIANPRGRISDLRSEGYVVECLRDEDGIPRYRLLEVDRGTALEMGL